MPIPDLSKDSNLRAAADAMATGPIAYLLGAGASVAAGLPNWGTLLTRLLDARGLDRTAAARLLEAQDNLLVAEAAFAPRSRPATRDHRIYDALYGTSDTAVAATSYTASNLHIAVAQDAARRGPHDAKLMTLNYDDLLEEALVDVLTKLRYLHPSERVHARASGTPRASNNQFEVHHLHGLLPRESRESLGDRLVLTLSDYLRILESGWQRTQMCEAVQHGPTLMLGTSYSNPDVRTWLGSIRPKDRGQLLAVIARPALGLTRPQMDVIEPVLVAQWQSVGVTVMIVDDYATPTQIVRELAHLGQPDYVPPNARVATILARRVADLRTIRCSTPISWPRRRAGSYRCLATPRPSRSGCTTGTGSWCGGRRPIAPTAAQPRCEGSTSTRIQDGSPHGQSAAAPRSSATLTSARPSCPGQNRPHLHRRVAGDSLPPGRSSLLFPAVPESLLEP